jgi:4-diphosphocytidyl-2-C-methyl-D-erythritol kinase
MQNVQMYQELAKMVEVIDEAALDIKYITPKIKCNTGDVYRNFRDKHYKELSLEEFQELKTTSLDILQTFDARSANDLCGSAVELYPEFLTGSGSTVFALSEQQDS